MPDKGYIDENGYSECIGIDFKKKMDIIYQVMCVIKCPKDREVFRVKEIRKLLALELNNSD
tara:strand:+ start:1309 stop:1491 length:183 start_codon:yes stop_codon:yes gene_type:complete